MHRQLISTARDPDKCILDNEQLQVQFFFENPPSEYGWHYYFGVREAFLQQACELIEIDRYDVRRAPADNLEVIMSNFVDRVTMFRLQQTQEAIFAYWMLIPVGVPRTGRRDTVMPAMACSIVTPHRTLGSRFDTVLRNPDKEEDERLAQCLTNTARVLPVAVGNTRECAFALELIETLHEGLRIGCELAHPSIMDPRFPNKMNG